MSWSSVWWSCDRVHLLVEKMWKLNKRAIPTPDINDHLHVLQVIFYVLGFFPHPPTSWSQTSAELGTDWRSNRFRKPSEPSHWIWHSALSCCGSSVLFGVRSRLSLVSVSVWLVPCSSQSLFVMMFNWQLIVRHWDSDDLLRFSHCENSCSLHSCLREIQSDANCNDERF